MPVTLGYPIWIDFSHLFSFSKGTNHSHSFQVYPMVPLQICEPGKGAKLGCKLVGLPEISNIFRFLAAVNPWQKMVEKTGPTSAEVGNCQGLGGQHEEGQHPSEQFIHSWRAAKLLKLDCVKCLTSESAQVSKLLPGWRADTTSLLRPATGRGESLWKSKISTLVLASPRLWIHKNVIATGPFLW